MFKKGFLILFCALGCLASCNKMTGEQMGTSVSDDGQEIVLSVGDGFDVEVETKVTAITNDNFPSALYWGATTGTIGKKSGESPAGEGVKWDTESASISSKKISTGKYQTATPTAYNYYVANQTFTITAATTSAVGTAVLTVNNNTDVICGKAAANSSTTPSVVLNHIFARTGTFNCNTQSGYTISVSGWTIVGKSTINGTAGKYDISSDTWTTATTKLTSATAVASSSDMYLIPGTYTLACTYTLTKGDYTKTFTKHADVTLVKGKINNITATATGGDASDIKISVSVTDWTTNPITATWTD